MKTLAGGPVREKNAASDNVPTLTWGIYLVHAAIELRAPMMQKFIPNQVSVCHVKS